MTCRLLELQENLDDLRKQKAGLTLAVSRLETEIIHLKLQIEAALQERERHLSELRQVDEKKDSFDDDDF